MASLSLWQLAFCALVVVSAYAVRGTTGFGGGAVAVPLMALALPLQTVVPAVALLNILSSVGHARRHWDKIAWRAVAFTVPFTVLGVAAGLYLFAAMDSTTLRKSLGGFVIAYAVFAFFTAGKALRVPARTLHPLGGGLSTAGGFFGALFGGAAGPLYVIYLSNLHLPRDVFRVTVSTTIFVQTALRSSGYAGLGLYDQATLTVFLIALPFMWIGGRISDRVCTDIEPLLFARIVAGVLLVSGAALFFK